MLCSRWNRTSACSPCQCSDVQRSACHNLLVETPPGAGYCISCGERLDPGHRFCPACGTARWMPKTPPPLAGQPPPPAPGTPARITAPTVQPLPEATPVPGLAWLFGAGAVVWLVSLAQLGGFLAAGKGRAQLVDSLVTSG